jgi:phosphonate transport system substrate-binding protein
MTTPLRFVTFLAPNMAPVYRFLADRIGQRLGRRVELVVGSSFDQFEQGEADLGVICGLPYVWLAARQPPSVEPLAAPVLAGARYAGRPIYYSDVIVRHDSPITRLEELEGRRLGQGAGCPGLAQAGGGSAGGGLYRRCREVEAC